MKAINLCQEEVILEFISGNIKKKFMNNKMILLVLKRIPSKAILFLTKIKKK